MKFPYTPHPTPHTLGLGCGVGSISILHACRLTPKGAATQTKPKGLLRYKSEMLPSGVGCALC
ncbi:MAG: hypothetical protein F6J93_17895 [Oscillatoria sp. SIO1A7]|nr:hypothetical protein [Oscillatoria sp. SIO1A7]